MELETQLKALGEPMPERSARKVVAIILLVFRLPVNTVAYYSGFRKSSLYTLRKELWQMSSGADFLGFVTNHCVVKKGRGALRCWKMCFCLPFSTAGEPLLRTGQGS
jgi:hypothetical protein